MSGGPGGCEPRRTPGFDMDVSSCRLGGSVHAIRIRMLLVGVTLAAGSRPTPALAQATVPTGFQDQLVTGGLSTPVGMAFLPDGRLFVIEQFNARVRLVVS